MNDTRTRIATAALSFLALSSFASPTGGGLASSYAKIETLSEAGDYDAALQVGEQLLRVSWLDDWRRDLQREDSWFFTPLLDLADPLLDRLEFGGASANERAAAHYARGVVMHERDNAPAAAPATPVEAEAPQETSRDAFERAIGLAVETGIRADASYNVGTLVLLDGEEWRSQIPEISGQAPAPSAGAAPPPGQTALPPGQTALPPGQAAVTAEPEEDPLEEAREAYLEAKELLIVRLKLDWQDPDTRANLELVLRRLEELDEIEEQREEQEQQDQEQQEGEDEQPEDQEQQDGENEPEEGEDQPPESEEPEEPQDPEEPEEPEKPEQPEDQDPSDTEPKPSEVEPPEQFLTREEVQRMLDKLKEHEAEGEKVRAQRRQNQRRRTVRDW